jgi:hypothetical protein
VGISTTLRVARSCGLSFTFALIMATTQSPMQTEGAAQPQENWPAPAQAPQNGTEEPAPVPAAPVPATAPAPQADEAMSSKKEDYANGTGNGDSEKGDYRGDKTEPKVLAALASFMLPPSSVSFCVSPHTRTVLARILRTWLPASSSLLLPPPVFPWSDCVSPVLNVLALSSSTRCTLVVCPSPLVEKISRAASVK